jgi:hypothetical protein
VKGAGQQHRGALDPFPLNVQEHKWGCDAKILGKAWIQSIPAPFLMWTLCGMVSLSSPVTVFPLYVTATFFPRAL